MSIAEHLTSMGMQQRLERLSDPMRQREIEADRPTRSWIRHSQSHYQILSYEWGSNPRAVVWCRRFQREITLTMQQVLTATKSSDEEVDELDRHHAIGETVIKVILRLIPELGTNPQQAKFRSVRRNATAQLIVMNGMPDLAVIEEKVQATYGRLIRKNGTT